MLCEGCENVEATFHLTELSNDVQTELHLCARCAKNIKLNLNLSDHSDTLGSMLSFLDVDDFSQNGEANICLICGLTGKEFEKKERPGCPSCYKYLSSVMDLSISRMNSEKYYTGKKPLNYIEIMAEDDPMLESRKKTIESSENINQLNEELRIAVFDERYEDAAKLRDRIKEVKSFERTKI